MRRRREEERCDCEQIFCDPLQDLLLSLILLLPDPEGDVLRSELQPVKKKLSFDLDGGFFLLILLLILILCSR